MQRQTTGRALSLEGDELLTVKESAGAGKYSDVHYMRLVKKKQAPQPVKLSARALRFRRRDVIAWLNGKTDW